MGYLRSVEKATGEVVFLNDVRKQRERRSFDEAVRKLKAVGVILKKTGQKRNGQQEYKVNVKGGPEAYAIYTTDLQEALESGLGLSYWSEDASYTEGTLPYAVRAALNPSKVEQRKE